MVNDSATLHRLINVKNVRNPTCIHKSTPKHKDFPAIFVKILGNGQGHRNKVPCPSNKIFNDTLML